MNITRVKRLSVGEVVAGVAVGLVVLGLILVGLSASLVIGVAIVIIFVLGARNRANEWGSLDDHHSDE